MTTEQTDRDQQLPPEVAEKIRTAARRRLEGSTPFPRVEAAVRRDRRRRGGAVTLAAAACLVGATVVTGAVRTDRAAPAPPDRDSGPVPTLTSAPTPERGDDPYSRTGPTGGNLAGDTAWIDGLRQHAADTGRGGGDAARVRVLWAQDDGAARYAVTVNRQDVTDVTSGKTDPTWEFRGWRGATGTAPDAMTEAGTLPMGAPGQEEAGAGAQLLTLWAPEGTPSRFGVVVAFGRNLSAVEMASRVDHAADGTMTGRWLPLRQEGAVWWREFAAGQLNPLTVRALFADDVRRRIWGEGFSGAPLEADRMLGVSPAGTDRETLACASGAFDRERGGFPDSATPVLGATATRGEESFAVAAVRARGGGYLIGSCRTRHPEWGTDGADTADGFVVPAPGGGPENLFAVVPVQPGQPAEDLSAATATKLLAIAPAGATRVRFGAVSAPVENRMAIIEWPDRTPIRDVEATALDAAGRPLGTARVAPGAHEVEAAAFYDPSPVEPPRYVTPTN